MLKGAVLAKNLIRGTPEHAYGILDAYRYVIECNNRGSKTTLKLDEEGRFLYFLVAYFHKKISKHEEGFNC